MTVVLAAVLGLFIGSFLNVVIWRVPRHESIIRPGSHCPGCGRVMTPVENIPVVSFAIQRGRCRGCRAAISPRYPAVELATAALFSLAALRFGNHLDTVAYCVGYAGLLAIAVIDIEHFRIPNPVLATISALCASLLGVTAIVDHRSGDLARAATGAVLASMALLVVHLLVPRGMGMGDVKLAGLVGLLLGWRGLAYVALGLFSSFLIGAVVGALAVGLGRASFGKRIPFAPFLAIGCVITSLWGAPVVDWYLGRL